MALTFSGNRHRRRRLAAHGALGLVSPAAKGDDGFHAAQHLFRQMAKNVVAMFGSFYVGYNGSPTPIPEWNVRCDIEAAQRFVNSGAKLIYAGLDVTTFVKLDKANREKLLYRQSPVTNALSALTTLWGHETPTLFDAVAVGYALYPDLFKMQQVHVTVDKEGYTRVDNTQPPNCSVLTFINTEEFIKRIMQVYLRQNLGRPN